LLMNLQTFRNTSPNRKLSFMRYGTYSAFHSS
jgi:hypothetical protein